MLTDVGSLEFRILANRKHDAAAVDRAPGPRRPGQAPDALQVGPAGRDLDRHQPRRSPATPITDLQQNWKKDLYAGHQRRPDRQGRRRHRADGDRPGQPRTRPTR